MSDHQDLELALARVERRLRRTQSALGATVLLGVALALASLGSRQSAEVIRVRGIVVEDEEGKARVLIGAPVPETAERSRTDPASGLVLLDPSGADRLQIGNVGSPMMGGRVQRRIAEAVGLMVCDPAGNERAGFGYFANGQVGWGLDYESGEAIVAAVLPERGMAGIMINAPVEGGNPTRAMLMTTRDGTALRLSDSKGTERAVLEVDAEGNPSLSPADADGKKGRDVFGQ